MKDDTSVARGVYDARLAMATSELARAESRWNRVANARLVAFGLAVAAAAWALWGHVPLGWPLAALLLTLFAALALYHSHLGRARTRLATLCALQVEALARLDRRWDDLPPPWMPDVPVDHPYAADLDIVGHASLLRLLDTTTTSMGRAVLAAWLLAPANAATVRARQGAVDDLAPRLDLRQEVALRGRLAAETDADPEPILTWAETPAAMPTWLGWVSWIGPFLMAVLGLAQLTGVIDRPLWIAPLIVNLLVGATAGRGAYATIAAVATGQRAIAGYAAQLELLTAADFQYPALQALQHDLGSGDRAAPAMLRRLGRLAGMAIPPSSMLYLPLQAVTL